MEIQAREAFFEDALKIRGLPCAGSAERNERDEVVKLADDSE